MENLIQRMNGEIRVLVFLLILGAGVVIAEMYKLQAEPSSSGKRRKRRSKKDVRETKTALLVIVLLMILLSVFSGMEIHDYHLDRDSVPVQAEGVVTSAGYISAGKNRKKYRIKLDDGSEKGLSLYIHKSLIEDYGIEEGSHYVVTYYPRTKTLCEAEKRR